MHLDKGLSTGEASSCDLTRSFCAELAGVLGIAHTGLHELLEAPLPALLLARLGLGCPSCAVLCMVLGRSVEDLPGFSRGLCMKALLPVP